MHGTGSQHQRARPGRQTPSHRGASPARRCALAVVRRVAEEGAYADRALHAEAERMGLDRRERALATALAYGAIQRRATLDHLVERLTGRPAQSLDPPVASVLALGLLQLLFLDGIAPHAAVDQSVELAKALPGGARPARLVNAVLRRASREGRAMLDEVDDSTPAGAALRHSHPLWIAEMWWRTLGPDDARALMARDNEPAEAALRANTLVTSAADLASRLDGAGVKTYPADWLPEGLVLDGPFDAHGSDLWARGALMPQSRASMTVARTLGPRPGERVLDLCAAPGGKTTHIAALMEGKGEVVAVERHAGRAAALERTCERMHAANVRLRVADAATDDAVAGGPFDRVLVDPPCSGLGTLASRPDLRWRGSPEQVDQLAEIQAAILANAARAVAPGGTLVYSTCTLSPRENEQQIARFLAAHPDFAADDLGAEHAKTRHPSDPRHVLLLPHRDGTDGFFIARLRRSDASGGATASAAVR